MNMKPVSFEGCFGWLHQGNGGPLGVVLCASWDYEALATHPTWRVLADRLAAAGLPTLRFDYPGSGDSLGESATRGAFDAAVASIGRAAAFLKETTGVEQVALVGLRLGAAMALQAATQSDIAAAVLIRPVSRGKSYIAEQRALAKIIAAREGAQIQRAPLPGGIEIEGFRLAADAVEAIAALDLTKGDYPTPPRVLIAGEAGSRQYEPLLDRLLGAGALVTRIDLAEVAAWGPSPVPPPPPFADADTIAAWLAEGISPRLARPTPDMPGLQSNTFAETATTFGPDDRLTGILCRPRGATAADDRRVVVFLNTGANSHIGSGRSFVEHARALAERGVASLRMDCFGLGDSQWMREGPLGAIHHVARVADVSAGVDWLRRAGFSEVTLVGVCSGAFLAFQSALADPRVRRILIANPSFWLPPPEEALADPLAGTHGSTSGYLSKLVSPLFWRRLASGELTLSTMVSIARALAERQARKVAQVFEATAARISGRTRARGALVAHLETLARRGCEARLLLSGGDPAHETLAAELPGRDRAALDGLMTVTDFPGADHAFVTPAARPRFRDALERLIDGRGPAEAGGEGEGQRRAA